MTTIQNLEITKYTESHVSVAELIWRQNLCVSEVKREPPPRPPPPTANPSSAPSAMPYPAYPQGMPVPYGATPAAPYPTYMPPVLPTSYNPYAAAPYPQQGESDSKQQCCLS